MHIGRPKNKGLGVVCRRNQAFSVCSRSATGAGCLTGCKRVTHGSARLLRALLTIGVTASSLLIPTLRAQILTDEVHVNPRRQAGEDKSSEDPSLKTRSKPIKVDVHLVLLPVTITDLMDRPVTGLERDNFKVFDGKEPQDIRHFS